MTSRGERKEAARARREAEERAAHQAAATRRRLRLVGGGFATLAAVVGIGAALVAGGGEPARPTAQVPAQQLTDLRAAAKAAGARITKYDWDFGTGAHTTEPVRYPQNPPTNGPHHPVWAADGNYVGRDTPPTERLVHALEHGRIEIQYRPGLPAAQVAQLEALYREDPRHVLLFENRTGMDCDVAVTAWGHGLLCERFTPKVFDAVRAFRDLHRDQGPEYVA